MFRAKSVKLWAGCGLKKNMQSLALQILSTSKRLGQGVALQRVQRGQKCQKTCPAHKTMDETSNARLRDAGVEILKPMNSAKTFTWRSSDGGRQ